MQAQMYSSSELPRAHWQHIINSKGKGNCIAVMEDHVTATDYGVSLAIWDHTVLPATRHK